MKLSEHFDLSEFTKSSTAVRLGINNTPTTQHITAMQNLCVNVLEKVRAKYGAVRIESGYRCDALNKAIGGSRNSQHCNGEAADIEVRGVSNLDLFLWMKDNLQFDQLILEFHDRKVPDSGWVHVSYRAGVPLRDQVLEAIQVSPNKTEYHPWG